MIHVSGTLLMLAIGMGPAPAAGGSAALDNAVVRVERAEVTYERADIEAALGELSALRQQDPGNAAYAYYLARAYFPLIDVYDQSGDAKKAEDIGRRGLKCAQDAVALDPSGNPDAYRLLGDFYGRLTSFVGVFARMRYGGESMKYHKAALEKDPQSIRAVIGIGTDKLLAPASLGGDVAGAVELFRRAVAMDPTSPHAHVWLAKAYAKQKNFDLARQEFGLALSSSPASGFARAEFAVFQREAR
jgi:tetratricopeptide (TPR) repeat protein